MRMFRFGKKFKNVSNENELYNNVIINRMRTATSKFVTVFDVCVVVGACLCGAITGFVARRFIQKINSNFRKVIYWETF